MEVRTCLLLLLLLLLGCCPFVCFTHPLLLWSPLPLLDSNVQAGHMSSPAFSCLLTSFTSTSLPPSCTERTQASLQPSVLVAFLYPKLSSASFSRAAGAYAGTLDAALDEIVSSSKFMMEVSDLELSRSMAPFLSRFAPDSFHRFRSLSVSDLKSQISQLKLKDDQLDIVVVTPPTTSDRTKLIDFNYVRQVTELVASISDGNYAALISSESSPGAIQTDFSVKSAGSVKIVGADYPGPKYITADIVVGLVLTFFLLSLLVCFMGFLSGIETPLRFPRKAFDVSKEY